MPDGRSSSKLILDNAAVTLTLVDDRYVHTIYKEGRELTIDDFSDIFAALSESLDYKRPVIVERKYRYSIASDVYPCINEALPLIICAVAYVSYTPTANRLSVLSGEIFAPSIPSRVFPTMELAIQWIKEEHSGGPMVPIGTK